MTKRLVRVGIDVGGTHTKAVAINNESHEIIGKSSVKTTHDHERGVAAGVVTAFLKCLEEYQIAPEDVVFVAHSTTQATNALLEGDVAKVGVLSTAKGFFESFLAKRQTNMQAIDLGTGRKIEVVNRFVREKDLTPEAIEKALGELQKDGAEVVVASAAFGVDDLTSERLIAEVAEKNHLQHSLASEMTKLYGLSRRTRTAVLNASILPKMLATATLTEESVREAGVDVPLMIMRGDGGVMDVVEMKKRPVLTMLSGPAASVMGSLMYLRASNGIYFEVGGTSTNIGVIKNGRPAIDYSQIGGHDTYISSLDVRVLGVAGGSMIRANNHKLADVGPRSAHIGGMDYAVFTPEAEIVNPQLEFFAPKAGDPADYVAIRLENGKRVTITNTCAANVLGLIQPDHFSYGNVASAVKAMTPLAEYLNLTVEEVAANILQKSFEKIRPVILGLVEKYQLESDQISLIGVGGGAASLIVYAADKMNLNYSIPENAEVISSIGVALSMVQDVVERIIPNPTKNDILAVKLEAINKAIESGATEESVDVHIEIDPQTQKITAIATGSTEVQTTDLLGACTEVEALQIAAKDLRCQPENVQLLEQTQHFYVCGLEQKGEQALRIIDQKGFIRVQRRHGKVVKTPMHGYLDTLTRLWEELADYKSDLVVRPDFYICVGPRLMDFSTNDFAQLTMLIDVEMGLNEGNQEIIIVAANQMSGG